MFSTPNTFKRFGDIGVHDVIRKSVTEHDVDVKILVNMEKDEAEIIQIAKKLAIENNCDKEGLLHSIEFRPVTNSLFHTKITTFIVDSTYSLTVEIKESGAAFQGFEESVGMATYSNNQSTVDSYATIFETLWTKAGFVT